mmetsp:Transcript_78503/g.188259  ORF Transcript_78503/g.188259 Transcript_78503/m.188259 type:complete len:226 (-) Transcript_78503:1456-2133(-)
MSTTVQPPEDCRYIFTQRQVMLALWSSSFIMLGWTDPSDSSMAFEIFSRSSTSGVSETSTSACPISSSKGFCSSKSFHLPWKSTLDSSAESGVPKRSTWFATSARAVEWEPKIIAWCFSRPVSPSSACRIWREVWASSAEKTSSKSIRGHRWYTARASATRCFWPPLKVTPLSPISVKSWAGSCLRSGPSPQASSTCRYHSMSISSPKSTLSRRDSLRIQGCCAQ